MGTPNVFFIFNAAAQWKPLSGATKTTGFCTPDMALIDDGGGDVTLSGTANTAKFSYKGKDYTTYAAADATLAVQKGRKPKFAFNVADASANTNTFFLAGLALKNLAGGTGDKSFPALDLSVAKDGTTTLNLKDDNDAGAGTTVKFDFWVLVQNSSGDIGLIDPLVTNTN